MKKRISKNIFHFSNLIIELEDEKQTKIFFESVLIWNRFQKIKIKVFDFIFWFEIKKWISKNYFIFQFLFWNWKICFVFKSKNELYFWYTDCPTDSVKYLNFVFHIEVKTKSKYRILNFAFQFIKNTKWHFGYRD